MATRKSGVIMDLAAVITAITAIGALFVSIFVQRSAATKQELDSLRQTIQSLQTENTRLRERMDDLENENRNLKDWAEKLCCQIRDAGLTPVRYKE